MRTFVLLNSLWRLVLSCAATTGVTTTTASSVTTTTVATTTTTTVTCTSCTVGQITFTPQNPNTVGSIPATFTGPVADPATGCLTLTAVCTATAPLIAFMQFNGMEGGPEENEGMTVVVMAPLNCINGNWVYIEGVQRIVTEVNCSEAAQNAGGKKKKK